MYGSPALFNALITRKNENTVSMSINRGTLLSVPFYWGVGVFRTNEIGKKLISIKMAKMTSYINAMCSFLISLTYLKHLFLESH